MADKHTAGPWVAGSKEVRGPLDVKIAWCGDNGIYGRDGSYVISIEEAEANARLCAAAPDLLEALRDMAAGWEYIRQTHGDSYGVGWDRAQEKATAAIAKATGEGA